MLNRYNYNRNCQRLQIQMKRQNSLAIRQTSVQSKPLSKVKKNKNVLLAERKPQSAMMKAQEMQETNKRIYQYLPKDDYLDRFVDKMKLIKKIVDKFKIKEERQVCSRLVAEFQRQEKLREHLNDCDSTKNKAQASKIRELINHTISNQYQIIDSYVPVQNNYVGSIVSSGLIAHEWSPKVGRLPNATYGILNKIIQHEDKQNYQANKKISSMNGSQQRGDLFGKIFAQLDQVGYSANVKEEDSGTFKSFMKSISNSLQQSKLLQTKLSQMSNQIQQLKDHNQELQVSNRSMISQQIKLKRQLSQVRQDHSNLARLHHNDKEDYQNIVNELKKQIQQSKIQQQQINTNFVLKINQINSLKNQLACIRDENLNLQTQIKQSNQDFQVITDEKLKMGAQISKLQKQLKSLSKKQKDRLQDLNKKIQNSKQLISEYKTVESFIKSNISEEMQSMFEYFINMVNKVCLQHQKIVSSVQLQDQQIKKMLINCEKKNKQLQQIIWNLNHIEIQKMKLKQEMDDFRNKQNQLKQKRMLQQQTQQYKNKKQKMSVDIVLSYSVRGISSNTQNKSNQICFNPKNIDITIHNRCRNQIGIQTDPKFNKLSTLKTAPICKQFQKARNMATYHLIQQMVSFSKQYQQIGQQIQLLQIFQNSSQTNIVQYQQKELQTQSQAMLNAQVQKNNQIIYITKEAQSQTNIKYFINEQSQTDRIVCLEIEIQTTYQEPIDVVTAQIIQTGNQTDNFDQPSFTTHKNQNYSHLLKGCLSDNKRIDQPPSTIISMLIDAQECLLVPEIVVLRQQIAMYRNQLQNIKKKMKQTEKEKEEQNIFQFSL